MFGEVPLDYPITFTAGVTLRRVFGIVIGGVALDMAGWDCHAVVRLTDVRGIPLTGSAVLQATTTYDATTKKWTLDFPTSVSAGLTPTIGLPQSVNYVWDWKLVSLSNVVYVPLAGVVTVLRKVTL